MVVRFKFCFITFVSTSLTGMRLLLMNWMKNRKTSQLGEYSCASTTALAARDFTQVGFLAVSVGTILAVTYRNDNSYRAK